MNSTFWNWASFFGSVGTLRVGADASLWVLDVAAALEKCFASSACAASFLGAVAAGSGTGHACCDASRCLMYRWLRDD
jgi:hypothetical protein